MNAAETKPKWRRRAEDRPDEVLDAALTLFARNGFAATKVEDIASEAGLSKGAIYRYFPSKEDIFESLVKRAIAPIADRTEDLARTSHEDPAVLLKAVLSVIAARLSDPDTMALPRIVLQEAGRFPELAETYRRQVIDKGIGALELILQKGIATGQFRPVDAHLAIRNVMGPLLAHMLLTQIFRIDEDAQTTPQDFIESHFDILMNGLLRPRAGG
ncbi:TetR/AcrR family transcriptional regulator [Hoeflea poritis]|uniref:TetR/AcrR family transcriptional regulator n=1 Tax=Hoeflea poritis TaxID=2993659 RepID=A0ABT4VL78_9HYPH|nr:TetR/AcrR family transcriptional regulator [Hoeflea poritis]MDA4845472.1 TetR/AcrR family transcriptional regulator [Hoeflea poritis]